MSKKSKKNGTVVRGSEEFRKKMSEIAKKRANNPLEIIKHYQRHLNVHPDQKEYTNKRKSDMCKKTYAAQKVKPHLFIKKKKLHKRINIYTGVITEKQLQELYE